MPTPLSPSSSQEIIPISPPPPPKRRKTTNLDRDGGTSFPLPSPVKLDRDLEEKVAERLRDQKRVEKSQSGESGADKASKQKERRKMQGMSRTQVTARMMKTLGKDINPITNSDLYSRTDHFVSAATGHQQSNRGGGSAGVATYWEVRNAKMAEQNREKRTDILSGCVFYINGSTGPKLSNVQLQHMITSNGGRFTATQNSSCTHIIANGGLSGSKTQKWIDGQAGRGGLKRLKIIRIEWVIDSVEKGRRLSEVGYGVIEDPSQKSLLSAFSVVPQSSDTPSNNP